MKTNINLKFMIVILFTLMIFLLWFAEVNFLDEEVQTLIINEVIPDNFTLYYDENGEYYDLIEIYNSTEEDIELQGYGLSDDSEEPYKWQFPELTIKAGEYLLVSASGNQETDGLYTNFKLDKTGEKVFITDPSGKFISSLVYKDLQPNMSYGYDGEEYVYFLEGSPGVENTGLSFKSIDWYLSFQNLEPEVNIKGGIYDTPQEIEFKQSDKLEIRYTLDCSDPSSESLLYKQHINIDYTDDLPLLISNIPTTYNWHYEVGNELVNSGQVIKAQYFYGDIPVGKVSTNTYFIWEEGIDRYSFDVVSVTSDADNLFSGDDGIMVVGDYYLSIAPEVPDALTPANYNNKGRAWERSGNIEIFDENGVMTLSQNIGIKVSGGYTRTIRKKNLRIIARDEYDENQLTLGIFDVLRDDVDTNASIDTMLIRTGGQDWNETMFRDVMTGEIMDTSLSASGFTPVIMFLNGEYYGVYNLREDMNEEFVANHFDLEEDEFTMIEDIYNDIISIDEDEEELQRYQDFFDFLIEADMRDQKNYEYVESMMDMDNYLDYLVTNIIIRNSDFYDNNIMLWRYTGEPETGIKDGRYRYVMHDLDMGYDYYEDHHYAFNSFEFLETRWDYFFENLMTSDEFLKKFVNRLTDTLNSNLSQSNINKQIDYYEELYSPEAEENAVRWKMTKDTEVDEWYDGRIEVVRNFVEKRQGYLLDIMDERYNLEPHVEIEVKNQSDNPIVINDDYEITETSELVYYPQFQETTLKLEYKETDDVKFLNWYFKGLERSEIDEIIIDGDLFSESIEIKTDKSITIEAVFNDE